MSHSLTNIFSTVSCLVILAGCQSAKDIYPPIETKKHELFHEHREITLDFDKGTTKVECYNLELLRKQFINPTHGKQSVHVTLQKTAHGKNRLRLKNIKEILIQNGVTEKQIHLIKEPAMIQGNSITLGIDVYRVVTPVCPDWSRAIGRADGSVSHTNFGCATVVNFAAMIEDPIILFKGEKRDLLDSGRENVETADYRGRKELKLKVEKLDKTQS